MSRTLRLRMVIAIALVAGTAATVGALSRSEPDPDRRPTHASTSTTTTVAPPAPLTTPAGRGYLTIGTDDRRQFSEEEYRLIATEYQTVVFTKFHAGWEIGLHHEAASHLKELNPNLRVFAYMSTKYWFGGFRWGDAEIDPAWLLRDDAGELVPLTKESYDLESKELGYYVDPSQPAYRAWLVGVARSWMAAAPYDGIRLDAASPIGDFGDRDVKKWQALLSPERVDAYNEGIELLFRELRAALAPRSILFNGISPSPIRGDGRDLFMLDFTEGAMDEDFCTTTKGELHDILEDIEIMERYRTKALHLRARYGADLPPEDRRRVERACAGSFLMGWQPGYTFLNIGTNYSVGQLAERPPELLLDLGQPTGPHDQVGDLLSRRFERGIVYVNLGTADVTVGVAPDLVQVDGDARTSVSSGRLTLASGDAAFLVAR